MNTAARIHSVTVVVLSSLMSCFNTERFSVVCTTFDVQLLHDIKKLVNYNPGWLQLLMSDAFVKHFEKYTSCRMLMKRLIPLLYLSVKDKAAYLFILADLKQGERLVCSVPANTSYAH